MGFGGQCGHKTHGLVLGGRRETPHIFWGHLYGPSHHILGVTVHCRRRGQGRGLVACLRLQSSGSNVRRTASGGRTAVERAGVVPMSLLPTGELLI